MSRIEKETYRGFEVTHHDTYGMVWTTIMRYDPIRSTGIWSKDMDKAQKRSEAWIDRIVNGDSELLGLEFANQTD